MYKLKKIIFMYLIALGMLFKIVNSKYVLTHSCSYKGTIGNGNSISLVANWDSCYKIVYFLPSLLTNGALSAAYNRSLKISNEYFIVMDSVDQYVPVHHCSRKEKETALVLWLLDSCARMHTPYLLGKQMEC